ncbi:MAG TPA: hypothetical protein VNH17_06655 [Streptosporangiaceae bacterium]|nr:hypothetical protein [Streptosporangiaceae bacterium]
MSLSPLPPEPPLDCLVRDSEQQAAITVAQKHRTSETRGWKDPYGPDKTVFGKHRKACVDDEDYGLVHAEPEPSPAVLITGN